MSKVEFGKKMDNMCFQYFKVLSNYCPVWINGRRRRRRKGRTRRRKRRKRRRERRRERRGEGSERLLHLLGQSVGAFGRQGTGSLS